MQKSWSIAYRLLVPPGITVTSWSEIYLRPAYASAALQAWVMRTENDHVGDIDAWANGAGKAAATAEETKLAAEWYVSSWTAGWDISKKMKAALQPSLMAMMNASKLRWDDSGKHSWGNRNQRP